jgi:flagellar biosynthesis protein FliP
MISPVLAASTIRDLVGGGETLSVSLRILAVMTVLTVLPSIILMTTCFVRVVIVLSFVRRALGTQELPPNQIIIGLALFLTFMIMSPTWSEIWTQSISPYLSYQKTEEDAITSAVKPARRFMFQQIERSDLALFMRLNREETTTNRPVQLSDIDTVTVVSAFMTSELKRAFKMGFLIYLPFVVIDLVVASVLISMGMLVLPPVLISMPFKILVFVLVDGWGLIIGKLYESFGGG